MTLNVTFMQNNSFVDFVAAGACSVSQAHVHGVKQSIGILQSLTLKNIKRY